VHAAHFADVAGELVIQDASVLACNHCHDAPEGPRNIKKIRRRRKGASTPVLCCNFILVGRLGVYKYMGVISLWMHSAGFGGLEGKNTILRYILVCFNWSYFQNSLLCPLSHC
jgi:hypothetical protein